MWAPASVAGIGLLATGLRTTASSSYSARRASMGSIDAASRAGTMDARAAAISKSATTTASISGSREFPLVQ